MSSPDPTPIQRNGFMPRCLWLIIFMLLGSPILGNDNDTSVPESDTVSYYHQVRPVFQAKCHGCHQAAKSTGDYIMTSFEHLLQGGESETAAIVPGAPEQSYLLELVTPEDGAAEMPKKSDPLSADEIELIRRWISEGATNDTPADAGRTFDQDHPPVYTRPPVITSMDYSPDGQWLAIGGFHEVLLHRTDGSGLEARLIGLSERIESVRFSPDGGRLAVTGGRPGRMGEVQIWDVASRELLLSAPFTYDTLYGASWSPDGKQIAFGCSDSSLRAIDSTTGEQVVYMAAHDDWILGTTFSHDGQSVFSASRDKTIKKTHVPTERFLGNVTTHTPGFLLGGMKAIVRHPQRKELLAGGADGAPKLFKMDVTAARASGGNPNQIREYAALPGRIFDVAFSPDGSLAFAGSSLDGVGEVRAFNTESGEQQWKLSITEGGIFSLVASRDGQVLATAGFDGWIRLVDVATGTVQHKFLPVDISTSTDKEEAVLRATVADSTPLQLKETLSTDVAPLRLKANPRELEIRHLIDYAQLIVRAEFATGSVEDVTRLASWRVEGGVGRVSPTGRFTPEQSGQGRIIAEVSGKSVEIPITVHPIDGPYVPDFIRDVTPILSKVGCNAGTCHGAKTGKNGFKLSLRGYDPLFDVRGFTDDLKTRRINLAAPASSLMLLKCTASVPHEGQQVIHPDSTRYRILHDWIADGAQLHSNSRQVARVDIFPQNPVIQQTGAFQQMRVVATYSDGSQQDVTHESFVESGNIDTAKSVSNQAGLIRALRRGEAPILVRYEGAYASTILTIMGERDGFVWQQPPANNPIDEFVLAKLKRTKTLSSGICNDYEFARRVYLDVIGLPPSSEQLKEFIADSRDSRWKRDELIDRLVGSPEYVEHWTNKWADLLQVNGKFLGRDGAVAFRSWIRDHVEKNTRYDEFARKILTANGSNRENPAASYFKILRTPQDTMENTTHLFLATRFSCNKCHDHPFERWTQDQYYGMAAFFARVGLKEDPESKDRKIGGTSVESAKPYYEVVYELEEGEVKHDRTGLVTPPSFPYAIDSLSDGPASRRERMAAWVTASDNPYFATSYVNRLWGYLIGVGLIEPLDDIRAGNPPTNPELLTWLAREFMEHSFDTQHMIRTICKSRTYQLSLQTNSWNEDDTINYSHAKARRLPAEVLYDAVYRVTGAHSQFPGVASGTRAAALPDVGIKLPDGFLSNFGRPARESACECERTADLRLGPVMALVSGPTVNDAISDLDNAIARLVAQQPDNRELCREIFLRFLNRPPTPVEIEATWNLTEQLKSDHERVVSQLEEYRKLLPGIVAERKRLRQERMAFLGKQLDDYEIQLAPRLGQLELKRQHRLLELEHELSEYELAFPSRFATWEKRQLEPTEWAVFDPEHLESDYPRDMEKLEDLSVYVSGRNGRVRYMVTGESTAKNLTAVRLEVLTDERLPHQGPGRRESDGNFVLSEFKVSWAPLGTNPEVDADKQAWKNISLTDAIADFSQKEFDVTYATDGKLNDDKGWAIKPETGKNHTVVFETAEAPIEGERILLRFELIHDYGSTETTIGRFRISTSTSPRRVPGPLTDHLKEILQISSDNRNKEQQDELVEHFRKNDVRLKKLDTQIGQAKQPLPNDPHLSKLKDQLVLARRPLGKEDLKEERLGRYVRLSRQQLESHRLTVAQDLAWALINNPAFLFNR
ncbi:MAG: hypothetical protein CMJ62_16275 [Planctomycetaceae bacterium]|nr:hypothetical protein [Planctomycetaceae bacterium]